MPNDSMLQSLLPRAGWLVAAAMLPASACAELDPSAWEFARVGDLTRVHALAPADFDGDGTLEVAALGTRDGDPAGGGATLAVYSTRPPYRELFSAWIEGTPTGLDAGDLDNDGRVDLVVSRHSEATFAVFLHAESPFAFRGSEVALDLAAPPGAGAAHTHDVRLIDLDGDGHLDLVTAQAEWNRVVSVPGLGDGQFGPGEVIGGTERHPYDLRVIDWLEEDTLHVLTPNVESNSLTISRVSAELDGLDGLDGLDAMDAMDGLDAMDLPLGGRHSVLETGHLDGDEWPDLLLGGYESRTFSLFRGGFAAGSLGDVWRRSREGGEAIAPEPFARLRAPANCGAPRIADLDGDGRAEVVAPCASRQSVVGWERQDDAVAGGGHRFRPPREIPCPGLDAQVLEVGREGEDVIVFVGGWSEAGVGMLRRAAESGQVSAD